MDFPHKKSRSSIEINPKQRIIIFDEFAEGRFWGYELIFNKRYLITMTPEDVEDRLTQKLAVRLI